jgi:hypothetical protein
VESANHFDKAPALCSAFVAAISRYTGGSAAAIYMKENDGAFRLASGRLKGAKKTLKEDDPAFALMAAKRGVIELAEAHGTLPGELALPMLEQGRLAGFVLVDRLEDGTHYRPDQVELLDEATQKVGRDLRSLHARQMEAKVLSLADKLEWTEKQLERLAAKPGDAAPAGT